MSNYWIITQESECCSMEHVVSLTKKDLMAATPIINTILDNTVDAAALINQERKVIYISSGFAELTGQTLEEYKDHSVYELKIDGQAHIEQVLSDGVRQIAVPMEVGSQKLLATLVPIVTDGEIIGVMLLITFRSMAVMRRAIQTLERSLKQEPSAVPLGTV